MGFRAFERTWIVFILRAELFLYGSSIARPQTNFQLPNVTGHDGGLIWIQVGAYTKLHCVLWTVFRALSELSCEDKDNQHMVMNLPVSFEEKIFAGAENKSRPVSEFLDSSVLHQIIGWVAGTGPEIGTLIAERWN